MKMKVAGWSMAMLFVAALGGCMDQTAAEAPQQAVTLDDVNLQGCEPAPSPPVAVAVEVAYCAAVEEGTSCRTEEMANVSAANCTEGACALTCAVNPEGTAALDCDQDSQNGCEVDPYSDPLNCGGCGLACPGEFPSCVQKRCCNVADRECL